ncbi:MAG: Gfo/Idh/MocA family oxidoreductase, partial [Candidatus Glassbacteria bacterium]|nr:Gfo/Idh/MocA family oxidoreductase [Candidatus Glassbacteria bacterium]
GPLTAAEAGRPVRLGFVGVGSRGTYLLRTCLDLGGVEVPAVCDIDAGNLEKAQRLVEKSGLKKPEGYSRGPEDFRRMAGRVDLDVVINATPLELHAPVMMAAMEAGKYGATEVPAATTLDECSQLVETSERTGMPCMMLENYCYFRNVMMVLNMVQQGVFGEVIHCETGYQHDTRYVAFGPEGELLWRARYKMERNGNLYPTHAIGPCAWWMDINRGDRFSHLVSMSSKPAGMNEYIIKKFGPDHPSASQQYKIGAVNTTLIRTEKGKTVTLYYDTCLPRPFEMIYRLQGTEGIYMGSTDQIYLESRSPQEHTWEDAGSYYGQYEHPMWKALGETARGYSHGGGDYMMLDQLLRAVRNRVPPPVDVYDSAAWSVIGPLSELSVARGSAPVEFPDFTGGAWKTKRPVGFLGL